MRSISKALNKKSKSFLWILLAIFTTCVVLTSCIPKTDDDIIKLIEPVNASTGVRFNGTSFSFRGKPATEYELVIKNLNGDVVFLEPVVAQSETVTVTIPTKGKLRPNTTYRWYVRVKGSDAKTSDFWKFTTKENSAPSISNLQPNGLDGRPFGALALTWSATDADNDDLIFKVKVYEKGREIPQELEVSTDTCVVRNLKPTTEYTWTVVAQDPWGYRSEELTATFITKANEAPQLIELESPKDGATNVKFNNLTLQWKGSDPDYEDLKYSLTLKSTSESMNLVTDTSSTTFVVNDLKPATLYTLEITAKDSSGAKLTESFTFTTKENTFPAVPSLLEPSDGTKLNFAKLTTCTFKWSPSSDPDEDVVSYKFVIQLYDSGSSVIDVKPIGNTSYTVNLKNVLEVNKKYAWYVEAYDKHGGTSASQKLCFETYFNNPPSKPTDPTPAV
ncbi:MAG TPA: fibronectin type III domain-containing protein, partial [Fervidobacterium sp.]|nr:fibronectin type III domain-containing protein [Fervidobacterium sp.]